MSRSSAERGIFLSTLSLRRATITCCLHMRHVVFLSTLSLRRATVEAVYATVTRENFYPRSPCGERRMIGKKERVKLLFLSTLSLRRATRWVRSRRRRSSNFYPRSPCGERRVSIHFLRTSKIFLSTLSLRRATDDILAGVNELLISIHALLAESDYDTAQHT